MDWLYIAGIVASPVAAALLVAGLLAAVPLSTVLARRWQASRWRLFLALAVTAVVVAATQPISSGFGLGMLGETVDLGHAFAWWLRDWPPLLELLTSDEAALNVLLFATAAFSWVWTGRRAGRVLAAHVLWSIGIETMQAVVGQRAADPRDLITNAVGALVGTALGALWVALRAHGAAALARRLRTWLRRPGRTVLAAVVVIGVGAGIALTVRDVQQSADGRLEATLADVRGAYQDVTWAEVDAAVNDGGETNAFSELIALAGTRADSLLRVEDDSYQARFQAGTDLAPRCVLALWTQHGVAFRTAAGPTCTQFLG